MVLVFFALPGCRLVGVGERDRHHEPVRRSRDPPSIWVAVTIAMIAIGVMAAAVPEALTERAGAFAVGNAVIRLIWGLPWLTEAPYRLACPWWRPVAVLLRAGGALGRV